MMLMNQTTPGIDTDNLLHFACALPAGTTAPPADLMQRHNRPSLYSFCSMHAGEVFLIIRRLPMASLPSDLWPW